MQRENGLVKGRAGNYGVCALACQQDWWSGIYVGESMVALTAL